MTRRTLVQVIYQNYFNYLDDIEFYLSKDYEFGKNLLNKDLFKEVISLVFDLWDEYFYIALDLEFELDLLSLVAQSIIKAAIAEIELASVDFKIIINDYVGISDIFCSKEKSIVNKILDKYVKSKKFSETID